MGNVNNAAALVTKHIDDIKEVLYLLLRKDEVGSSNTITFAS